MTDKTVMSSSSEHPHQIGTTTDASVLEMHQDMLSRALRFYWESLKNSIVARRYLKERGLSAESVKRFGLGYAGGNKQGLRTIFPNYHVSSLVDSGLVIENERGRFDRFRNRIMFPILTDSGRVIAFGGRIIEGDSCKYLNSPETPLFDKGSTLFGLPQARASIEALEEVIVVEGYMDVVMSAQHGIANVVATLGTATTSAHVQKLMSTPARRIIFCFDGDDAGLRAAVKAMEACIKVINATTAEVMFMFLPSKEDPDSFVRTYGAEAFRTLAKQAVPFETFLLNHLRRGKDLTTCEGKAHMAKDALDMLALTKDAGLYYRLCEKVAKDTEFSVAELIQLSDTNVQRTWGSACDSVETKPDAESTNTDQQKVA